MASIRISNVVFSTSLGSNQRDSWKIQRCCRELLYMDGMMFIIFFIVRNQMSANDGYIGHVLNGSASKETHVFPKAPRFKKHSRMVTQAFYNLPSTMTKKTTSFGYGQKIFNVKKDEGPPPGTYQPVSEFKKSNLSSTTSMAPGRDKIAFGSFIWQTLKKNKGNPSPDRYNLPVQRSRRGGRMGQRINTEPEIKYKKTIPGPGTYKLDCTEMKQGNYILSTYKNNFSTKLFEESIDKSSRNHQISTINYNIQERQVGKYSTSKYKNLAVNTFSRSKRQGMEEKHRLQTPGFKYGRFSQFGSNV